MADSDEDQGRSRRLGVKDRGWSGTSRVLSGQTIGRSSDACATCIMHVEETRSVDFLV
jgi:hypothetical protein